jgi:diguanylate cyclase (GGDEF)-like protein
MTETIHWTLSILQQNPLILLCIVAVLVLVTVSALALRASRVSGSEFKIRGEGGRESGRNPGRAVSYQPSRSPERRTDHPQPSPGFSGPVSDTDRMRSLLSDMRQESDELREQIHHLKNYNALLLPMIKELNAEVNPEQIGNLLVRAVDRLFNPETTLVFLRDHRSPEIRLAAASGVDLPPEGYTENIGAGLAGLAAAKKVTVSRGDLRHESNLIRTQLTVLDPTMSEVEIACPIVHRDICIGVICVGGVRSTVEKIRDALNMVGELAATALTNARQYQKIQTLANSDPLTGLVNKGYLLRTGATRFKDAQQNGKPLSLAMFDLDHFKHYNDVNGHMSGDQALAAIAEVLQENARPGDIVGRFGGEEFILLMPDTAHEVGCEVAERVRVAVMERDVQHREKQPLGFLSVSGGVATTPYHGLKLVTVLERADEAMYAAKRGGRNSIVSANCTDNTLNLTSGVDR